jgi:hypothetical protein
MTTTLDVIRSQLRDIQNILETRIGRLTVAPNQIVTLEGLSDIDTRLGIIQAGEFRTGNGKIPGDGFTGVRIGFPAFTYANEPWHLVGVNNDVLQVGINAEDGKLYAGGGAVVVGSGGVDIYVGATHKTSIQSDGDLFIGSDIDTVAGTTMAIFTTAQTYDGESMGAGDLMIGDHANANIFWDASAGQLKFRDGTVVNVYVDTNGAITAGAGDVVLDDDGVWIKNQQAAFGFEDTSNNRFNIFIYSDGNNSLVLKNASTGTSADIRMDKTSTLNHVLELRLYEHASIADLPVLLLQNTNASANAAQFLLDTGIVLTAGIDGSATVFNEDSFDLDFRIEGATVTNVFKVDAGFDRVEIGADHFFATRSSTDPNTYINEANQDMDTYIRTLNNDNAFVMDAGLNKATSFLWDGWGLRHETWTRTGNHTFTVSGDVTAVYRKSTKVRYKDGGAFEYGVIASSSHSAGTTTITLITNSDYAMAAATITDTYLSYIENPEGFPITFNYTITVTPGTGSITSYSVTYATWQIVAGKIRADFDFSISNNGTGASYLKITWPITSPGAYGGTGLELNVTGNLLNILTNTGLGCFSMTTYANAYPAGTGYRIIGNVTYPF